MSFPSSAHAGAAWWHNITVSSNIPSTCRSVGCSVLLHTGRSWQWNTMLYNHQWAFSLLTLWQKEGHGWSIWSLVHCPEEVLHGVGMNDLEKKKHFLFVQDMTQAIEIFLIPWSPISFVSDALMRHSNCALMQRALSSPPLCNSACQPMFVPRLWICLDPSGSDKT